MWSDIEKVGKNLAKKLCEEDPVRKNIPYDWRVNGPNREMFHWKKKQFYVLHI